MSDSEIPWDVPSRYGAAGLLARRVLRRALRPVTVRTGAEIARLHSELSALRASSEAATTALHAELQSARTGLSLEIARTAAEADRLRCLTRGLRDELASSTAYGAAIDAVLGSLLARGLPPGSRHRTRGGDGSRVICSLATGDDYRALRCRSALSFERYAQRWGWDVIVSSEELSDGRPRLPGSSWNFGDDPHRLTVTR